MNKNMIAEGTTMGATTYSHKKHATAIAPFYSSFFETLHKEQWKEVRLGEAPLQIIDGDRGKNYPKQKELFDNGYCLFLNTKNVLNAKFDFTECQFINKEKDESLRKGKMQINDIVLTTRGTIGNMALYRENINYKNIRINSGMVILRPDTMEVNSTFLLYAMLNSKKYIDNFVSGSAQPQLPIKDLSNLTISLPPLETQRKVAEILSSFDDKIDLLHRQNKTLESLALTLFRHTFINNPNRNDWEMGKLGDWIIETIGGDWGKEEPINDFQEKVFCIRGTDIADLNKGLADKTPIRYIKKNKLTTLEPKEGDIIFEISGGTETQSTGRCVFVNQQVKALFEYPIVFSNFCKLLRVKKKEYSYFFFLYLQHLYHSDEFFALEKWNFWNQKFEL